MAKRYTEEQLEQMFEISEERIERIDQMMTQGVMPGVQSGPVVMGRPRKFDEHMTTVSFKEIDSRVAELDKRASEQGISRSDYLRMLVAKELVGNTGE